MSIFKPSYQIGEIVWWKHSSGSEIELKIEGSEIKWYLRDIFPQRYYCVRLIKSGSFSMSNISTFLRRVRERELCRKGN
ncbi:MAG: hypothetical protein QXS38_00270 [Candidatus Pacearchaeota archaeon]